MTDWLPELDDDDLATLIEALEAWEHKDAAVEMFGDVVGALIDDKRDPAASARFKTERDREKLTHARARAVRKERSILLRAKLLMLRDRRRVERTVDARAR